MAIFLSLFMAENCFKRLKTAESRGLSGATPSTCTQGWPAKEHNHHFIGIVSVDEMLYRLPFLFQSFS